MITMKSEILVPFHLCASPSEGAASPGIGKVDLPPEKINSMATGMSLYVGMLCSHETN